MFYEITLATNTSLEQFVDQKVTAFRANCQLQYYRMNERGLVEGEFGSNGWRETLEYVGASFPRGHKGYLY